ncbi:class I SAM-dependent methyltransferase [Butyrivibrio sp. MC2013]|uniref:class I SAM-dependent methyltransferase n=1 Tax=Butyrivibrio sp. MC2013 TaxID=1280686 RepID=UPI00040042C2|nr:class I SAM-dependent methyltransferase [Butyrivibrio sp. MC2013]
MTDKRLPKISLRLRTVCDMVDMGSRVADVGTDHGFVPITLIMEQRADHAIAMDVRKGPLERAAGHVSEYGLTDMIECRLSDGLEKLMPGESNTLICAGMGGVLMERILRDGCPYDKGIETLVLEPQSELESFRRFLRIEGYEIIDETLVFEEGKYYPVIKAIYKAVDDKADKLPLSYRKMITELLAAMAGKRDISYGSVSDGEHFCTTVDDMKGETGLLVSVCDSFGPVILAKKGDDLRRLLMHSIEVCDTILSRLEAADRRETERYKAVLREKRMASAALCVY